MGISSAWGKVVTLWSSKADMDKIFTFNILKYIPTASVEMLGRKGGKVILFTDKGLFVLERAADGGWEHSVIPDLLDFSAMSKMLGDPVTEDRKWTALEMVGASKWGGVGDSKVLLWNRAEKQMVEETLSGCEHGCQINSILCKHPFIILSLFNEAEDEDIDDNEAQINVYKLEWDEEDVSATLVKSINFPETDDMFMAYAWDRLVCNTYFFALIKESKMGGSTIYLFERKHLLNEDISGYETQFKRIYLESAYFAFVRLNTTSIVFIDRVEPDAHLCKIDYWMGEAEIDL